MVVQQMQTNVSSTILGLKIKMKITCRNTDNNGVWTYELYWTTSRPQDLTIDTDKFHKVVRREALGGEEEKEQTLLRFPPS